MSSLLEVWWDLPAAVGMGEPHAVLSFLAPATEEYAAGRAGGQVLSARQLSLAVRPAAQRIYRDIVARLGTVAVKGETFRRALRTPEGGSLWWYHPVAFKDCEEHRTYEFLVAVLTIVQVARERDAARLRLVGAPAEVERVLRGSYPIDSVAPQCGAPAWKTILRGATGRLRYLGRTGRDVWRSRRLRASATRRFDVALLGFWDWSVQSAPDGGGVVDRIFPMLPPALAEAGLRPGWLAWLSAGNVRADEAKARRALPLDDSVVVLQSLLGLAELATRTLDPFPMLTYGRFMRTAEFKAAMVEQGLDFGPLFAEPLLAGFCNSTLGHFSLLSLAVERACRRVQPRLLLSFQEHFSAARAGYAGACRAGAGQSCAVQHASYSHEKTYLICHPSLEFAGQPDGCAMPRPDFVFAMGGLAARMFAECGYLSDQIHVTGSPRYSYLAGSHAVVNQIPRPVARVAGRPLTLLLVPSLAETVELDMIEAAVAAASSQPGIRLRVRKHPFSTLDRHQRFKAWGDRLELSRGTLAEDLAAADVILFTFSTVAEEAFIAGKTVWQWLPLGFNGSALAEVASIRRFAEVAALRDALVAFTPAAPAPPEIHRVVAELFGPSDGFEAIRIAAICAERLRLVPAAATEPLLAGNKSDCSIHE